MPMLRQQKLIELRYEDVLIYADLPNVGGYYSICFMGVYDPFLRQISGSDVVIDGGANIGVLSLLASRKAKVVYAVEPNPRNFDILRMNLRLNHCDNVVPINAALSERVGRAFLRGEGEVAHLGSRGLPIEAVTIDSVSGGTATCIKLDVEGATMLAMRGINSLDRVHTICFELEQDQLDELHRDLAKVGVDPGSYATLIESLKCNGYEMTNYNGIGVRPKRVISLDLLQAEAKTHFFATKAFIVQLVARRKNLFYAPSLTDTRIDTLYFSKRAIITSSDSPSATATFKVNPRES